MMELNDLYLDLLKRALNNYLYLGDNRDFDQYEIASFYSEEGQQWNIPEAVRPHSLLNTQKLNALQSLMYDVVVNDIPGDFIEAGVYKGGTVIFMLGFLKAFGIDDRMVWAADSFQGIPQSKRYAYIRDPVDSWTDRWETGLEEVQANIFRYGLANSNLRYLEGYFADTLPGAPLGQIAIARLDGDAYESTRDALEHLYPRLTQGGYVIIDDWHLESCKKACLDFRNEHQIDDPIAQVLGGKGDSGNLVLEAFWRVDSNPFASY